jgi:protein-S-isoprenylcysteine O-methyltransferase Ste14
MKSMAVADAESRVSRARAIALDVSVGRPALVLPDVRPEAAEPRAKRDVADSIARLIIVGLFSFMAVRLGANFLETGRLTGLLLLASEALVVVLTVFRRAPIVVDRSLRARLLTTLAMMGPPFVVAVKGTPAIPDAICVSTGIVGLLVVVFGKLSLGRSFGLMPANRGIVSSGLYRFVRHPIYLGYLITHVAFVAANASVWNISLLVTSDIALLARALCEEKTLTEDPEYAAYRQRVRWRIVPGLF